MHIASDTKEVFAEAISGLPSPLRIFSCTFRSLLPFLLLLCLIHRFALVIAGVSLIIAPLDNYTGSGWLIYCNYAAVFLVITEPS